MSCRWKVDRAGVREPFASDVTALLEADPAEWVVHYGRRTRDEQAKLYAIYLNGGPRAAPPGQSAHEAGLAVDVTLIVPDGPDRKKADWDYTHEPWQRLVKAIRAHPRLHSLANIGDWDHIEAVQWRKIAAGPVPPTHA